MTPDSRDQRLQSILHAYLQALDRGDKPDRQAFLDAHPDLRDELAEYFADASKLDAMAKSLKTAAYVDARSAASSAPKPEEIASAFPQFDIVELLGVGGMGAVYKVRQKGLDRFVALKILPRERSQDAAFAERFLREAKALARLNHPNVVAVYDVGQTTDGLCYFVMEFIDGINLRQAMQAGAMTPKEALAIVPQICDALQYAHDEGIVHRDIKPENVLLDKKGRVKIADFGLAKLLGTNDHDAALTGTHQVMGTLRYMAPEQMEGSKNIDHRADIYSLGVVFYELLTGEVPMGRFAPPSKKVQIDVRLDEVVLRALEREPEQRWQHASEVKMEVEGISQDDRIASKATIESAASLVAVGPPANSSGWFRLIASLAILMLHGAAFLWPSAVLNGQVYRGWEWVTSNAGAVRAESLNANIFFWIGLILFAFGLWRSALAVASVALLLTAWDHAPFDENLTYLAGFWMWLGGLSCLPLVALFGWRRFGRAQPWHVAGAVLAITAALVIRFNLHYMEGPPRPAPFVAFFAILFTNLGFLVWAYIHSLQAWLRIEMPPERRIRGPAIGLIAVGVLGTVIALALLIAITAVFIEKWRAEKGSEVSLVHLVCMIGLVLILALRITMIVVGFRLHTLRGRSLGLAVGILALLPLDPVAIFAIPVGIWVLATLLRDDVAAALRENDPSRPPAFVDPVLRRMIIAFALAAALMTLVFGLVWATIGYPEAAVWASLTWLASNGLLLFWLPRETARPALITSWTLACVAVYFTLWYPSYHGPHTAWGSAIGYVDRHYWPYAGTSKCVVTLTPKDKLIRRVTITNEREIHRNGYASRGVVNWSGPGWAGERTRDAYSIHVELLRGHISILDVHAKGFRHRLAGTVFEWIHDRPLTTDDLVDLVVQDPNHLLRNGSKREEIKVEEPLRQQCESLMNLIRLAQSDDDASGSWKRETRPVGYLAFFVGREELDASLKGTPFYWNDYIGTHDYSFGPTVSILYVGVPAMLGVFLMGLLFLVRSRLAFRTILALLIGGITIAIGVGVYLIKARERPTMTVAVPSKAKEQKPAEDNTNADRTRAKETPVEAKALVESFLQLVLDKKYQAAIALTSDHFRELARPHNDHPNAADPVANGLKRWLEGPIVLGDTFPVFTRYEWGNVENRVETEGRPPSYGMIAFLDSARHRGTISLSVTRFADDARWRIDTMAYQLKLKPDAFPFWKGESIEHYAAAAGLKPAESLDLSNGVKLDLVLIPAGMFVMGAVGNEAKDLAGYQIDTKGETPAHPVTIARPFYMGKYEVTQAQWLAVMGKAPKHRLTLEAEKEPKKFGNFPVEDITFQESNDFCKQLSAQAKRTARLPSEAEWEHACRAGTTTYYYFGDEPQRKIKDGLKDFVLKEHLQYGAKGSYEVGTRKPNPWGLYDLLGNVAERVADLAHDDYQGAPTDGSPWTAGGDSNMTPVRGGSWENAGPLHCRSAARGDFMSVNFHSNSLGMRVVVEVSPRRNAP